MSSSSSSSDSSYGEQISAAAYALGPLTPGGVGPAVEGVAIALGIVAVIVVGLRTYVRLGFSDASSRAWGFEDGLVVAGLLPFIPAVVFAVYAARYGIGSHDSDLPSALYQIRAAEYQVYWELLYFVSSTIIKCAVGCACIRVDRRRRILWPVTINMGIMVIVAILAILFVFLNCKPVAATWNPYLGTCQKTLSLTTVSYIVSAVQMATDWACATIPFFIVAGLQMSRRKKISVVLILGLGIFASVATCVRMPYLKYYDTETYTTETMYHFGIINICSNVECGLGIIGVSLPPLRKLFKFYYGSTNDAKHSHTGNSSNFLTLGKRSTNGFKLDSLTREGHTVAKAERSNSAAQGDEERGMYDFEDDSSRRVIIRKTEFFFHHKGQLSLDARDTGGPQKDDTAMMMDYYQSMAGDGRHYHASASGDAP